MKKRISALLLALVFCMLLVPAQAGAEEEAYALTVTVPLLMLTELSALMPLHEKDALALWLLSGPACDQLPPRLLPPHPGVVRLDDDVDAPVYVLMLTETELPSVSSIITSYAASIPSQ